MLFPRTDVSLSEFPSEAAGSIAVLSNDLILIDMGSSRIIFELDFGLVPRLARTSHTFEQLHKAALREGRVTSVLNDAYFDALKRGILFWTGTGWSEKGSGLNF